MWYVIVGGLILYFALGKIGKIIVTLPIVLGFIPLVLAFFAAIEYFDPSRTVRVEQLLTEKIENAIEKSVPDIEFERGKTYHMVDRDDGTTAILPSSSLRHFLIVLLGAKPPTIPTSDLQTRVEYRGDAEDEKLYVEDMLSIQWPAIEISTSSLRKTIEHPPAAADGIETDGGEPYTVEKWDQARVSKAILFFGVGSLVGNALVGDPFVGAALGTVPLLVSLATIVDGSASFSPSAVHATPAKASRITETREHTIATTFGELEESIANLEADAAERGLDIAEAYISQTSFEHTGRLSTASKTLPRSTQCLSKSGQRRSRRQPVSSVASRWRQSIMATCFGVRVDTRATLTSTPHGRFLNGRLALSSRQGRWHGPCSSRGTTTVGRSHHALPRGPVPTRSAQTGVPARGNLPPWGRHSPLPHRRNPTVQPWEDVKFAVARGPLPQGANGVSE